MEEQNESIPVADGSPPQQGSCCRAIFPIICVYHAFCGNLWRNRFFTCI